MKILLWIIICLFITLFFCLWRLVISRRKTKINSLPKLAPSTNRELRVKKIIQETTAAKTLVLEDCSGEVIRFLAGQYLTLKFEIKDQAHWRSYSFSGAVSETPVSRITIKRIGNGLVSNWIHNQVREGDVITAVGPAGRFVVPEFNRSPKHLVFIAGGSGITPIYAMIQSLLVTHTNTVLYLIYGNKCYDDIIFLKELSDLVSDADDRLRIMHVLDQAPSDWCEHIGILDVEMCNKLIQSIHNKIKNIADAYFICGPELMMKAARKVLKKHSVSDQLIREERFTPVVQKFKNSNKSDKTNPALENKHAVTFKIAGQERTVNVPQGQTLLETGLAAELPLPFSCMNGECGTCRVRIRQGRVKMPIASCLSRDERNQGYVLACVAKPVEAVAVEIG